MNFKKFICISVIVVLVITLLNEVFIRYKYLDEPQYFEHYIDFELNDRPRGANVYYVKNTNDKRSAVNIILDENNYMYVESVREFEMPYYTIVELFVNPIMVEYDESMLYKNVEIQYNNNDRQKVAIGELSFQEYERSELAHMTMVSGSTDNTGIQMYDVNKPINIEAYDLKTILEDNIEVFISTDDTSYKEFQEATPLSEALPVMVEHRFKISSIFNYNGFKVYDVFLKLKTSEGDIILRNMKLSPDYQYEYIKLFLESRSN